MQDPSAGEPVEGGADAMDRRQRELLLEIAKALAAGLPPLVRFNELQMDDPQFWLKSTDAEVDKAILVRNAHRLLGYLERIKMAEEARTWFGSDLILKDQPTNERRAMLGSLRQFAVDIGNAQIEQLIADLKELKYRDPKNLFGLKSEEPKRGFMRR
ncbi:MAG: hypothetical protein ACYCZN_02125 [Candidatus Dormibacteria bacterium]